MIQPAVVIGSLSSDGDYIVGYVPTEVTGYVVRAIHICVAQEFIPTEGSSWSLQLCRSTDSGVPTVLAETVLDRVVRAQARRIPYSPYPRVPPGSEVILRAYKRGSPGTISGLSLALEYGITGVR